MGARSLKLQPPQRWPLFGHCAHCVMLDSCRWVTTWPASESGGHQPGPLGTCRKLVDGSSIAAVMDKLVLAAANVMPAKAPQSEPGRPSVWGCSISAARSKTPWLRWPHPGGAAWRKCRRAPMTDGQHNPDRFGRPGHQPGAPQPHAELRLGARVGSPITVSSCSTLH